MNTKNTNCLTLVAANDKSGGDINAPIAQALSLCAQIAELAPNSIKPLSSYACDALIDTATPRQTQHALEHAFEKARLNVDICIQPHSPHPQTSRRKALLICDMDSTLIGQECIDELAGFAGVKAHVSDITERAMRGELNFETALRERVALLKGLPLSNLHDCFERSISLNDGARTLARTMNHHGAKTVIVSGGFTFFSSRIAQLAGFEHHHANKLKDDGHVVLGEVTDPILGREAKLSALNAHSQSVGGPSAAIAIGDGANDLAMITAAGLGVAYYAKPTVRERSDCAVNFTDLTTALFYQGYHESEFIKD